MCRKIFIIIPKCIADMARMFGITHRFCNSPVTGYAPFRNKADYFKYLLSEKAVHLSNLGFFLIGRLLEF